jgi:hypothetical protein
MTKKCFFGGSILGLVRLAVPPTSVTFRRRTPFKGMTTRARKTAGLPRFIFRLKSFARGDILIDKHGGLKEMRLCGRQHAEIWTIPLTFLSGAHIRVGP